ncbi:MAG: uroporphyrinogen-III synthase [Hyphomonadaceae bacterium]
MRVAITRALPEAEATAARLRALGAEPLVAPLLTIVACAYNTNVEGAQALLFTSINGVRAFPDVRGARDCIVLAVGDATAEAARAAGFANVRSADGDVAALAALANATLEPSKGKLIHIAGAHLAGDLAGELHAAGFIVERRIAYQAVAVTALPAAFSTAPDAVLFYSARAAEAFLNLGAPGAEATIAACMSPGVAEKAAQARWKTLIVAPAPREDALLAALLQG